MLRDNLLLAWFEYNTRVLDSRRKLTCCLRPYSFAAMTVIFPGTFPIASRLQVDIVIKKNAIKTLHSIEWFFIDENLDYENKLIYIYTII